MSLTAEKYESEAVVLKSEDLPQLSLVILMYLGQSGPFKSKRAKLEGKKG